MPQNNNLTIIILAAGQGTRMKSSLPKVCHSIGGAPLIWHVLSTAQGLLPDQIIAVLSPGLPQTKSVVDTFSEHTKIDISLAYQVTQEGTGHAVIAALPAIKHSASDVLVLYGDTPLLTAETLQAVLNRRTETKADVVVLGMRLGSPNKYGRIFADSNGTVEEIIEYTNATAEQLKNTLCNSGVMLISGQYLHMLLDQLSNKNPQGEYLLTDIIAHARKAGLSAQCIEADACELQGVNTRHDLACCEIALQQRWRDRAMSNGVTLIDPQTVYFSYDTSIAEDVIIQPNVFFGPGVTIKKNVRILSNSHIEGALIGEGATIGPFARIRHGTVVDDSARIGNFVEVKKSHLKKGAKVNHLSYIGDAEIGEQANIGAGTITCNYDGFSKHKTIIGDHAFIGSNTALIAPVEVGNQAIIGAGSVITVDVMANAVAYTRTSQTEKIGAAQVYRHRKSKVKSIETKGD